MQSPPTYEQLKKTDERIFFHGQAPNDLKKKKTLYELKKLLARKCEQAEITLRD